MALSHFELLTLALRVFLASNFLFDCTARQLTTVESTNILKKILSPKFINASRPHNDEKPLAVNLSISIDDMVSTDRKPGHIFFSGNFLMHWYDKRLQYETPPNVTIPICLSSDNVKSIWFPDLWILDERGKEIDKMPKRQYWAQIYSNGSVYFAMRLSFSVFCPMNLFTFPFDKQRCVVAVESYGYNKEALRLDWLYFMQTPVIYPLNIKVNNFLVKHIGVEKSEMDYGQTGIFDQMRVVVDLERDTKQFVVTFYIPIILIVVLSWISFWIDYKCVPARASLPVTTFLTLSTLFSSFQQARFYLSVPVLYEVYINFNKIIVFAVMVEYGIVAATDHVWRKEIRNNYNLRLFGEMVARAFFTKITEGTEAENEDSDNESDGNSEDESEEERFHRENCGLEVSDKEFLKVNRKLSMAVASQYLEKWKHITSEDHENMSSLLEDATMETNARNDETAHEEMQGGEVVLFNQGGGDKLWSTSMTDNSMEEHREERVREGESCSGIPMKKGRCDADHDDFFSPKEDQEKGHGSENLAKTSEPVKVHPRHRRAKMTRQSSRRAAIFEVHEASVHVQPNRASPPANTDHVKVITKSKSSITSFAGKNTDTSIVTSECKGGGDEEEEGICNAGAEISDDETVKSVQSEFDIVVTDSEDSENDAEGCSKICLALKNCYYENQGKIHIVDQVSRFLFPFIYILFHICYIFVQL